MHSPRIPSSRRGPDMLPDVESSTNHHAEQLRNGRLQQIGLQHPRIKQVRRIIGNTGPNHRHLLVAEGLWAHEVLLDLRASIEMFLWCPDAAHSDAAHRRSIEVAALARTAYQISPAVLDRICERERPDGMVSLVALPSWDLEAVPL